jgi:hypothetical protein
LTILLTCCGDTFSFSAKSFCVIPFSRKARSTFKAMSADLSNQDSFAWLHSAFSSHFEDSPAASLLSLSLYYGTKG